jgi:2-polyprenyl-3-methyl-5-hydroxy-6-metoxy-1,4-benzoquinol methylase
MNKEKVHIEQDWFDKNPWFEEKIIEANVNTAFFSSMRNEALFGLVEIKNLISKQDKCLDVGAGTCLLSMILASNGVEIDALEPKGTAYSDDWENILRLVEEQKLEKLTTIRERIETFSTIKKYDFIYSINAFEHVSDWRKGLLKVYDMLEDNGTCLILVPNYHFPYESHLKLPIIINKKITEAIFQKRIAKYELDNDYANIWASLNFIKSRQVESFLTRNNISFSFDRSIFSRMLNRIKTDKEFQKRQKIVTPLVRIALAMRLDRIYSSLPIWLHPYMALKITKKQNTSS